MRDPYEVLGCSRRDGDEDIKRAYRKLAKDLHPDRNRGDAAAERRFKEVGAAYAVLGDPERRARFDRGEIDADGSERAPFGFGGRGGGFDPHDIFSDFFSGFGGQSRGRRARRGGDTVHRVTVPFRDAVEGGTVRLQLGSGRTVEVRIPAGTQDGMRLRLPGKGDAGVSGGPPGDVHVEVLVAAHPHFVRSGDDILLDLPITLAEAVRGGKVTVPTVTGPVAIRVPPMTSSGTRLRLRGKGGPDQQTGRRGDQVVRLMIVLPKHADPELERFVDKWSADADPRVDAGMV